MELPLAIATPWTPPPHPPDQSDHRGKKRNLQLGNYCRATFGTQIFGSQTPPRLLSYTPPFPFQRPPPPPSCCLPPTPTPRLCRRAPSLFTMATRLWLALHSAAGEASAGLKAHIFDSFHGFFALFVAMFPSGNGDAQLLAPLRHTTSKEAFFQHDNRMYARPSGPGRVGLGLRSVEGSERPRVPDEMYPNVAQCICTVSRISRHIPVPCVTA